MPALHELLDLMYHRYEQAGLSITPALRQAIEAEIRKTWPGQRFYVTPHDSKKDPKRVEQIRKLSQRLPSRAVAKRFDVSPQYVNRVAKK